MHSRSLPIAQPCDAFRPSPGNTFCRKCEKHVHDISAMTKREATRFFAANAGQKVCIAYRAAKDGTVLVRPEPRALGVVLMALGLAACAGYAPEIEQPGDECRDESGYVIDCRTAVQSDLIVLADDAPVDPSLSPPPAGPLPSVPVDVSPIDIDTSRVVGTIHVEPDPVAGTPVPAIDEGDDMMAGTFMIDDRFEPRLTVDDRHSKREARRATYGIDPTTSPGRVSDIVERADFVPSAELFAELRERREDAREARRERRHRRAMRDH